MLVNAYLKEQELREEFFKIWDDPKYQYFFGEPERSPFELRYVEGRDRFYASVDDDGNLVGYIGYSVDMNTKSARQFGIMRFPQGNMWIMGRDIRKAIDDIFLKFNLNRLEFAVVDGNPIIKSYEKYLPKIGGRKVGVKRQAATDMAGNLCDFHLYEVLKEDYLKANPHRVTDLTDAEIAEFVSKQFHTVEPVKVIERDREDDCIECIVVTKWEDEPGKTVRRREAMCLYGDGCIETENGWFADEKDEDAWWDYLQKHNVRAREA